MVASDTRSVAARKRIKTGKAGEAVFDQYCQAWAQAGEAWIYRVPTAYKIVGTTKLPGTIRTVLACVPERKTAVDYMGHTRDGHAVLVEVKTVSLADVGKDVPLTILADHQIDALRIAWTNGAHAFVAVVSPQGVSLVDLVGCRSRIPWSKIEREIIRSPKEFAWNFLW